MGDGPLLNVTASVVAGRQTHLYPLMVLEGAGTREHPLLLILLLRHADYVDETASWQMGEQTREVMRAMHGALIAVCGESPSEHDMEAKLRAVLALGNQAAATTGTYYSALVAMVIGARIAAAGIGQASMSIWRAGDLRPVLPPSMRHVGSTAPVLTAGLGLGFDAQQLRTILVDLDALEVGLLMVGADSGEDDKLVQRPNGLSAEQVRDRQLHRATAEQRAALVALVRNVMPDPR